MRKSDPTKLLDDRWSAVDEHLSRVLSSSDDILEAALKSSAAAGLPAINVSPNQGKLLMLLAKMQRAERILEIGTLGGYSTIWLARGLAKGGRLITLELESKHAEVARTNIKRAGLSDQVEVRVGAALESLKQLASENQSAFDLIFIDADKEGYPAYLEWSLKLSRPGTVLIADNVVRKGDIIDAESSDSRVQGARTFLEKVGTNPRLTATAIQTVGIKGYDGFAIAMVGSQ
jgi:predicted O-methyltransferase YrrM